MDDLISREELLKAIKTWDRFGVDDTNSLFHLDNLSLPHYVAYIHYDDVIKCIKGMPSVKPQEPEWIPVSERLPEEKEWIGTKNFGTTISDEVYVTLETLDGERFCDHIRFQNGKLSVSKRAKIDAISKGARVIAWMPLPKPYEPQERSDRE